MRVAEIGGRLLPPYWLGIWYEWPNRIFTPVCCRVLLKELEEPLRVPVGQG